MRKIASSIKYKKAGAAGSTPGAWGKLQEEKWVKFCKDTADSISSCLKGDEITPCLTKTIDKSNPKTAEYVGKIDSITSVRMGKLKIKIELAMEEAGLSDADAAYYSKFLTDKILEKHDIHVEWG